jgi:hypothetical protein
MEMIEIIFEDCAVPTVFPLKQRLEKKLSICKTEEKKKTSIFPSRISEFLGSGSKISVRRATAMISIDI